MSMNHMPSGGRLALADSFEPGWRGREISAMLKYRGEDGWGPRPPPRKPGDRYVVAGAVVGMSAGGILGFTVGIVTGMLGIAAGGVSGALIGSLAGSLLGQRK